ncbi:MAG: hypothetical protein Q9218_004535 [Villophora microphyllina]
MSRKARFKWGGAPSSPDEMDSFRLKRLTYSSRSYFSSLLLPTHHNYTHNLSSLQPCILFSNRGDSHSLKMIRASFFLCILTVTLNVLAKPSTNSWPHSHYGRFHGANGCARALYIMTNDPAGNSIIALKVTNGTLTDGSITPTGGKGLSCIDQRVNRTSYPDGLFSQSAVDVRGNTLIVVNPGSNTLTMMAIDPHNTFALRIVGSPVSTMGDFPVTVAISPRNNMACVANSGAKAGIACFSMHQERGLAPLMDKQISFPTNQTTPPVGPWNTVSQVLFNRDESALLTTVKGDPRNNITGFLSTLPIQNDRPAAQDTRSVPNGIALLFGTTLIPGTSDILATDAFFGALTISLDGAQPKTIAKTTVPDQADTCWAVISPVTRTGFVTDLLVNSIVEIEPLSGRILQNTILPNDNPGMTDLVAAGKLLYALSPGLGNTSAAVAVVDVSQRPAKLLQNFEFNGGSKSAQGMAWI